MDLFPDLPGFDIEKSRDTKFATAVQTAASGKELRATFQAGAPRFEYALKLNFARRAGFSVLTPQDELLALLRCYNRARGKLNPLLLIDPVNGQTDRIALGVSDGARQIYQLTDDEGWAAPSIQSCAVNFTGMVVVPCDAYPWHFSATQNSAYQYFSNGGSDPVVIPATPGTTLAIAASGVVYYGPAGSDSWATAAGTTRSEHAAYQTNPSVYCGHSNTAPDLCGLVGAFTDAAGNVVQPVWIGTAASLTVPAGATQLQLGVNDFDQWGGNTGMFFVTVTNTFVPTNKVTLSSAPGRSMRAECSTFDTYCPPPPGVSMSWSGSFARAVRFSDDSLSIKQIVAKLFSGDSIKLASLK